MNTAVLKVSSSAELTILKTSPTTGRQTIGVVYSLNMKSILSDCYSKLSKLDIDEFHVVLQGNITLEPIVNNVVTKEFMCGGINKYSIVSQKDMDKLIYLGEQLKVEKLLVYDLLSIFELMGKDSPIILCGDYFNNQFSYMYITPNGIEEFRIWRTADAKQLQLLSKDVNCGLCLSIFNSILDIELAGVIANWSYLSDKTRNLLNLSLGCLLLDATKSYSLKDGKLLEDKVEKVTNVSEPIKSFSRRKSENKKTTEIKSIKSENKSSFNKLSKDKILTVVGIVLSIALAANVVANKQIPKDLEYLNGKKTELVELVNPKQSTLDYFTKYSKALEDKTGNIDASYMTQISSLEVNGILAEIKLQKDTIGLVVYLREAGDIDDYVAKLGDIMEVSQVANKGTVSLDNTTLTKFIINGLR